MLKNLVRTSFALSTIFRFNGRNKSNQNVIVCLHKISVNEFCTPSNQHLEQNISQSVLENDYVSSYHSDVKLKLLNPQQQLASKLRIKKEVIEKLFEENPTLKDLHSLSVNAVINIILENLISKESVIENPFILRHDADVLKKKITLLQKLDFENINDLVPLLQLSYYQLNKILNTIRNDKNVIPASDRLHYISQKLNIDLKTVVKYTSTRVFMLLMPIETLEENLNHMINFGVKPMNILRDLWAFRYTPDSVEARLERAISAKKGKIMPWMVRCPEPVLQKSLKLSMYEKQLLGDKKSIIEYLSHRLEFDPELMKAIMARHPAVFRVRIKKVKEVLDYLLDEAGYSAHDIARCPRILCHGLKTTKSRIEELKSYGCKPSSLIIICRSKREYEKFLHNWITVRNKLKVVESS